MQLEIIDQRNNSYLFNNISLIPKEGDEIIIYKENTSAERIVFGTVKSISWHFVENDGSSFTISVKLE